MYGHVANSLDGRFLRVLVLIWLQIVWIWAPGAECNNSNAGSWELIGGDGRKGSWDANSGHNRVRSLAVFEGNLYAGIGIGDAEVWRFDGVRWQQVGGRSIMNSWPARSEQEPDFQSDNEEPQSYWVNTLLADAKGENLFAGLKNQKGAQLWRYDGSEWSQIGGLNKNGDWESGKYNNVYTLAWHRGWLYCGLQSHLPPSVDGGKPDSIHSDRDTGDKYNRGEIYRYDGLNWEQVGGPDFPKGFGLPDRTSWIYKLISFRGELYAAIGRYGVQGRRWTGEVWRLSKDKWEPVGGEGFQGSWRLETSNLVTSMFVQDDRLFIGYNCQACDNEADRFANVWAWDGRKWESMSLPVNCRDKSMASDQRSFNDFALFRDQLIVGGGRADSTGQLAIWALGVDGGEWCCLGSPEMDNFADPGDAAIWNMNHYVYSMAVYDNALYAGFRGPDETGHLWRYLP